MPPQRLTRHAQAPAALPAANVQTSQVRCKVGSCGAGVPAVQDNTDQRVPSRVAHRRSSMDRMDMPMLDPSRLA